MLQRLGAVLCVLTCLSFGLQAYELDILSLRELYPIDAEGGAVLRLVALAVGVWLWFGPGRRTTP